MSPNRLARLAAASSIFFGLAGIAVPEAFATAFGVSLDATGLAVARLACASYVGLGILDWMARDLTDAAAWRAIAIGNLAGWAISAAVVVASILGGLGDARAWVIVALQASFAVAWALASGRAVTMLGSTGTARA